MHHIVQHQLSTEREFDRLLDALKSAQVTYSIVKVVPFAHEIMPDINPDGEVMVWGAHTICKVAKKKGWNPGAFINDNFDMRILSEQYKENMLNSDAIFCTFEKIPEFEGRRFIRPVHDTKCFTGDVIHSEEMNRWKESVLSAESYVLDADTPVMLASVKELSCEARFFIVDGIVVTGSTYRMFGNQVRNRIDSGNPIGTQLLHFAKQMINWWYPDRAFVIDIALTEAGPKVIEINCLNASGLYDCDIFAIVNALEKRH